jgi:hypothetical protein
VYFFEQFQQQQQQSWAAAIVESQEEFFETCILRWIIWRNFYVCVYVAADPRADSDVA